MEGKAAIQGQPSQQGPKSDAEAKRALLKQARKLGKLDRMLNKRRFSPSHS
jgi:hypothetical protein